MGYWYMCCAEWDDYDDGGKHCRRQCGAVTCSDEWIRKHSADVELATDGTRQTQAWYCGLRIACHDKHGRPYAHECESRRRGSWCVLLENTQRAQAPDGEWTLQTRCFRVPSAPDWVRNVKAAHVAQRAAKFFARDPPLYHARRALRAQDRRSCTHSGRSRVARRRLHPNRPSPPSHQLDRVERARRDALGGSSPGPSS